MTKEYILASYVGKTSNPVLTAKGISQTTNIKTTNNPPLLAGGGSALNAQQLSAAQKATEGGRAKDWKTLVAEGVIKPKKNPAITVEEATQGVGSETTQVELKTTKPLISTPVPPETVIQKTTVTEPVLTVSNPLDKPKFEFTTTHKYLLVGGAIVALYFFLKYKKIF